MVPFASDNISPVCPEVMKAILAANTGNASSYGTDDWSRRLQDKVAEVFDTDVTVFPALTGTASNALALSAMAPAFGKIYCHALAHINTDECNAPEFFSGGAKLVPLDGAQGRFTAQQLEGNIRGTGNVHLAQPAAVSIAQSCEAGTLYTIDETRAIADVAHHHGLQLHMDGARFANAVVALGRTPAEITWKAGVDVLSLGGTKNGCLAAEAIVFFGPRAPARFQYLHKRAGQLVSKMRFISAQLCAYLENDVWLHNAQQANAMARRLSEGLQRLPGVELAYPTQSNEIFAHIPRPLAKFLEQQGYPLNDDELDGSATRFVAAWNTQPAEVDELLQTASRFR